MNTIPEDHESGTEIHTCEFLRSELSEADGVSEADEALAVQVISDRTGDLDRGPCPGCPGRLKSDVRYYPTRGCLISHLCADCGYRKFL
jgi:hypothetical protein